MTQTAVAGQEFEYEGQLYRVLTACANGAVHAANTRTHKERSFPFGIPPMCSNPAHGRMAERGEASPETRWCGTWYDCQHPRCRNSALVPSAELEAHLEAQGAGR